jgi:hypothetical protein
VVCIGRPLSGSPVRQPAGAQVQAKAKNILRGLSGTESLASFAVRGPLGKPPSGGGSFFSFCRFRRVRPQIPMKSRDFDGQKNA